MEQSAGGTPKQQVNGTGDQKSPSSLIEIERNDDVLIEIERNDDILIEILLRLPVISLLLFKSVSKRWLALITDPYFTLLRTKRPIVDQPCGFLIQRTKPKFTYVPLDPRIPVNGSPKLTIFRFCQNSVDEIVVSQSCNGLILCWSWPDDYYVYNPTLNAYKLLPLPHVLDPNRTIRNMAIAFDPIVSPYYKVLCPHTEYTNPNMPILISIYSSKTGSWIICAERFRIEPFEQFINVVYWKDAVHWFHDSGKVFHFSLDLEKPGFIQVETPNMLNGKGKLYESRDRLLLVRLIQPLSLEIDVYEMKRDYSGWSVIYNVNLNHIIEIESIGSFTHLPNGYIELVRAILMGDEEDDTHFVLEVPGKLIRYNIVTNIYNEICQFNHSCCLLFIPTLASV